jgi:hypothetical protein
MDQNDIRLTFINEKVDSNPKKIYHWTKASNVDNILRSGLSPSSGNWKVGSNGKTSYKAIFFMVKHGKLSKMKAFKKYKRPEYELLEIEIPSNYVLWKDSGLTGFYSDEDPEALVGFDVVPAKFISVKAGQQRK